MFDAGEDEAERKSGPRPPPFEVEALSAEEFVQVATAKPLPRDALSPDQALAYETIMTWLRDPNARQWLTLGGLAGTGKTTLVSTLAAELAGKVTIAFGAYTGKAANVLGRKLHAQGIPAGASTLHSLMYIPLTDKKGRVIGWQKRDMLAAHLIVVDEASMVGEDIWNDLVAYDVPILAVGDHGQLPPVGAGAMTLLKEPDVRLERIHRQAEGNPIIALAHFVRNGGHPRDFRAGDDRVRLVSAFPQVAEIVATGGMDVAAICYFNKTRVGINDYVRKLRGFRGPHPDPTDTVVCLKNSHQILFNGMRGRLRGAEAETDRFGRVLATVDFPDDGFRIRGKLNLAQFNREKTFAGFDEVPGNPKTWHQVGLLFDYGYAVTCHKSQGSQWREVVLRYERFFKDTEDTRRRWLYTAVTRAAERVHIIP